MVDILMNATVGQILGTIAAIVAIITAIVEFNSKIKKFPITAALNWIGERTNKQTIVQFGELRKEVDKISAKQEEMEKISDERAAVAARIRILRFSDELRRHEKHSQESYEQTITDLDNYAAYCDAHPGFKNHKTGVAQERIMQAYKERLDKNDFL